jgi:hypothetical protein
MRDAVEEVGRAVDRIDNPARLGRIACNLAGFFQQEPPVRPGLAKLLDQGLLGAAISRRDEVGRPLRLT